jgi:hypothetical protein
MISVLHALGEWWFLEPLSEHTDPPATSTLVYAMTVNSRIAVKAAWLVMAFRAPLSAPDGLFQSRAARAHFPAVRSEGPPRDCGCSDYVWTIQRRPTVPC